jgi:hypothetical protein
VGAMTARFSAPSGPLALLQKKGLVSKPPKNSKGLEISLTAAGKTLLDTHTGLSRRATEIVYCQL